MEELGLNRQFGGAYAGRRVLVTGHTGFKGSWLVLWLRALGARVAGLSLDPETNPSHWTALDMDDVPDHRVDLRDRLAVQRVLDEHQPQIIFHLAAQALVRRSYRESHDTFDINVMGLVNLLEAVRQCPSVRVLVNATTDKVYEVPARDDGYRESDPLGGHDPYSSSKACAELVSSCYRRSFFDRDDGRGFGLRLATARAGNVIGGGDWSEDRLVPDLVRAAISGQSVKLRHPAALRPWQHVLEPLAGYLSLGKTLIDDAAFAEAWNFGPDRESEITVDELADRVKQVWPAIRIEYDGDLHPHEASVLRLNCEKARSRLSWRPVWTMDTAVSKTASWYRTFHDTGRVDSEAHLADYVNDARTGRLAWAN